MSNISYMNSFPPSFSFISPLPIPGIVSTGSYFSIYIHMYTVFALYSTSTSFLLEWLPSRTQTTKTFGKVVGKREPHTLLMGIQISTITM
jgi:hypothetical protein